MPDVSTSMRKMLKLDLMSLQEKFENVSAGAAKVSLCSRLLYILYVTLSWFPFKLTDLVL